MYVKTVCPVCGTDIYHNVITRYDKYRHFDGDLQAYRYILKNIDITDTLTETELIRDVLQSLQKIIYDGIEVEILAGILKENYGITDACCKGLIERIQLELDMYCPDRKRLYFVEASC